MTLVYRREESEWRLAHRAAAPVPLSFPRAIGTRVTLTAGNTTLFNLDARELAEVFWNLRP